MSELSVNVFPTPELLNAASSGAASPAKVLDATAGIRPGTRAPAEGQSPVQPFAALLAGVLQGAQPLKGITAPTAVEDTLTPTLDESPASGADPFALLALPGHAGALPAVPSGTADAASATGNTLPLPGKPLPADLGETANPAGGTLGTGAGTEASNDALVEPRSRIFLTDLALRQPVEPSPAIAGTVPQASTNSPALSLATRSLAVRGTRTHESTGGIAAEHVARQPSAAPLIGSLETVPTASGATDLSLHLSATDFLRGTVVSGPGIGAGTGTELLSSQLAAFAGRNDNGSALAGTAALTGADGADTSNAALLSRLGSTTLPMLQPLGDAGAFAGGLADRLLTLGGPGAHSARLKLHPEHLGALDVEIQIDDGTAQVWFSTTTSQAREAIEGSLNRLRELFADQGIALTRTHVDAGTAQMGHSGSDQQRRTADGNSPSTLPWRIAARTEPLPGAGTSPTNRTPTRLLDVWA